MLEKKITDQTAEKVIEIVGLSKSFGSYKVLENASVNLYKGENLVVLAKSGTRKSVLIKILIGLLRPDKGLVRVL
ncbi:MAG: ATP-binding cassette domain-containing protein, partial [Pedobacter sp.]|nr:ATP-binding cassette domain-containing protein [Pedobacter sp.]